MLRVTVEQYGYDNLALSRTRRGVTTDVPWNWMPIAFAEAYFTRDWEKHDPELYFARRTQFPFTWASLSQRMRLTSGQREVIDASAASSMNAGLCVPLRGTDGNLDLISLSSSHKDSALDPGQRNAVALIALRALSRYIELVDHAHAHPVPAWTARSNSDFELDDLLRNPFTTPFTLPTRHLRALALVAIGARRWKMGLTKLASNLYLLRKCHPYDELERWGLVVDQPDDIRWRYYFKPSVLGLSYMRRAPETDGILREIWLRDLDLREAPDGLQFE